VSASRNESVRRARVVILGGGFGGLACAKRLGRARVDVLLIDRRNYHLFTPLLYQVATALLSPPDIAYPFRAGLRRWRNVRFRQASIVAVDFEQRELRAADGQRLPYDYLVLATGSENDYFDNPGLAEGTLGMKTLEQAQRLRNHVLACLEHAAQAETEPERRRWLSFVVVGGGPSGVEYAGALLELPMLSPPAIQEGRFAAAMTSDDVRGAGRARRPFRYPSAARARSIELFPLIVCKLVST
jgi:NADH dehydrogenase